MSEFDIFKQRESLISSQVFCEVKTSHINVLTNPLDFACANLVLLSPVNSEAISIYPVHLMWEYLATKNFLRMFSFECYTRCQYTCLILPQWVLKEVTVLVLIDLTFVPTYV